MHYHVCKFSNAVRKSWWVPTPHVDGRGYVEGVLKAMEEVEAKGAKKITAESNSGGGAVVGGAGAPAKRMGMGRRKESKMTRLGIGGSGRIDLVIPMHEEIFYLAEACWFGRFIDKEEEECDEQGGAGGMSGGQKNHATVSPSTSAASSAEESTDKGKKPRTNTPLNPELLEALRTRLLAPSFPTLIMLHNKHTFSVFLSSLGLDHPAFRLVTAKSGILPLLDGTSPLNPSNPSASIALKPVFGRACSNVYHLYPTSASSPEQKTKNEKCLEEIDISDDNHYLAQEWLTGDRYCTYAVVRRGRVVAFGCYPVRDTIDGSSCVYFEAVEHPGIKAYMDTIAHALRDVEGPGFQVALDIIETDPDPNNGGARRLVSIECNPRATSGIHLFSGTPRLASAITAIHSTESPHESNPPQTITPSPNTRRQLAPGMLMWKSPPPPSVPPAPPSAPITQKLKSRAARGASNLRQYLSHMQRLMASKDVMFSSGDVMPSLMQPFLLTSYYEICRERGMKLPEMFQWDLTWEPAGGVVRRARRAVEGEVRGRGGDLVLGVGGKVVDGRAGGGESAEEVGRRGDRGRWDEGVAGLEGGREREGTAGERERERERLELVPRLTSPTLPRMPNGEEVLIRG